MPQRTLEPGAAPSLVFLPGASGLRDFWLPVASRLPAGWRRTLLSWPGAGHEPHDPQIHGFEDLIEIVAGGLAEQSDVVAQSMGGVLAIGVALRHPAKIRRLVLVATTGGIDVVGLGGADWRRQYRAEYPLAAPWICGEQPDYTDAIPRIKAPTLLLWGDADTLSPVSVGKRLAELLPAPALHVLPGGTHQFAHEQPDATASLIADHLQALNPEPRLIATG